MDDIKNKVLITGASGFVGSALFRVLSDISCYEVTGTCREKKLNDMGKLVSLGSLDGNSDWSNILLGQDFVIHTAAQTHIVGKENAELLELYRNTNAAGTINLALQAAKAGVRRFIFISSIKVNGESTTNREPYSEADLPAPENAYGISKMEAELGLQKIAEQTGMEIVIIRPPLVYGQGVKANFLRLLKVAQTKYPLPFGLFNNVRSMIYIGNLVDFITKCIEHPKAANQTFLVSDGDDVSLSRLLRLIRLSANRFAFLVPVPVFLFRVFGKLLGKKDFTDRLIGSLQINPDKANLFMNWKPPYNVEQGIKLTVESFVKGGK